MTLRTTVRTPEVLGVVLLGVVMLGGLVLGGPATAAQAAGDAPPEGLSVSIHDTARQTQPGQRLAYTVTVKNEGASDLSGRLVVTVPAYLTPQKAAGASTKASDTTWAITVPPRGTVSKSLAAKVGAIPKGELRVTTLASVYLGDASAPTVRSADADLIAGVTDPAHAVGDPRPSSSGPSSALGWIIGGAAAVVVVLAAGTWILLLRRRRAGQS